MPLHEKHRQNRIKNWVLLAVLIGLMLTLYAITIIRMSPEQ